MRPNPRRALEVLARTLSLDAVRAAYPALTDAQLRAILTAAADKFPLAPPSLFDELPAKSVVKKKSATAGKRKTLAAADASSLPPLPLGVPPDRPGGGAGRDEGIPADRCHKAKNICTRARVQCDGASRGNPGPAAAGVVITPATGAPIAIGQVLGTLTNNQAEYRAILIGLRECLQLGFAEVEVLLDSELAVKQINGQYKVKNADLLPLWREAKRLLARFAHATVRHVPRAFNANADAAANAALDGKAIF